MLVLTNNISGMGAQSELKLEKKDFWTALKMVCLVGTLRLIMTNHPHQASFLYL